MIAREHIDNRQFVAWPPETGNDRQSVENKRLYSRAFGTDVVDLNFEFLGQNTPHLISQLLTSCLRKSNKSVFEPGEVLDWTLAGRLQGLIAIAAATVGRYIQIKLGCEADTCNEQLELNMDLYEFFEQSDITEIDIQVTNKEVLTLRIPTANDQSAWLEASSKELDQLTPFIARSLIKSVNGVTPEASWKLSNDWLDKMSASLEQYDQLSYLPLSTQCPECQGKVNFNLDLELCILDILKQTQRELFLQIHLIASSYHWTEKEVVGLSTERRRYYLSQINGEVWA